MPTATHPDRRAERRYLPTTPYAIRLIDRRGADGQGDGAGATPDSMPAVDGYAAVFWQDGQTETQYMLYEDLAERILPGAFDRALVEDDVRALVNHNANLVLGRTSAGTLKLSIDTTGLRYAIEPPDTQAARDVTASIRRGDVSGSSFSFIPTDVSWREQEGLVIREIRAVQLFDVGPVTFPAYEATTAGLRSRSRHRDDLEDVRAELGAWRASGAAAVAGRLAAYQARARACEIG